MALREIFRPRLLLQKPLIRRNYSSNHHAEDIQFPTEGFGKTTRNFVIAVIGLCGWYKLDQHLEKSGEKHPITRWIEYHMTPEKEWRRINDKHLDQVVESANDKLIAQTAEKPAIFRLRYPEAFERASPNNIGTGRHVDLSDLKIKYDE